MGFFAEVGAEDWAAITGIGCMVLAGIALFVQPDMVAWLVGAALGGAGVKAGAAMAQRP